MRGILSVNGVLMILVCLLGSGSAKAVPQASSEAPTSPHLEQICAEKVEMGTPFRLCVYAKPAERMSVGFDLDKAFRQLNQINSWMSDWVAGTELNQINEAAGLHPVKVRDELFEILAYVHEMSVATEGAFDPSFNVFWGLYNFKEGHAHEPTETQIAERLPLVNYKNIELNRKDKTVFLKKAGMRIGLGGIGQGYGVDAVVKELKKHYTAGYADGSGDTYFWGRKPDGRMWITSIRDPRDKSRDVLRIYGTDFAITTSGDDEKFFMVGNRRVHHIIDPKTGKPSTASRQATVISSTATEADALDTASFVMGPKKAKKVLESRGLAGVMVTDQDVTLTKNLVKKNTPWGEFYVIAGSDAAKEIDAAAKAQSPVKSSQTH